jgi:hypothetical protein
MEYILHIVIMLNIYIMLVLSANLPVGMARLLTLCQAAFYGIGAYISAFFLMQFNLPFIVVALAVMILTGAFSWVVSLASVKLKKDYYLTTQLLIGTDKRCDVVIEDPGAGSVNTRIFKQGQMIYIEDMDSPGGTLLGGMRLYSSNRLRSGDDITIGTVTLRILF